MKILTKLLNTLLCIAIICVILFTQFVVFLVIAKEAGTETIHVVSTDGEDVSYVKGIGFIGTDIINNLKSEPKYRVRSAFKAYWWQCATTWLDVAIDKVWSVIRPVFAPSFDVRLLQSTYYPEFNENGINETIRDLGYEGGGWALILKTDKIRSYIDPDGKDKGLNAEIEHALTDMPAYIFESDESENYKFASAEELNNYDVVLDYEGKLTQGEWIVKYKRLYNYIDAFLKYNDPSMKSYYNAFISQSTGEVKIAAVMVYFQLFVALILGIYFTRQNRIDIKVDDEDSTKNRISGGIKFPGLMNRKHKHHRKRKKEA